METRWLLVLFAVVMGILLTASIAFAAVSPPTGISVGASSRRNLSNLSVFSVQAQAGNMTQINLSAIAVTKSWQGYYGNVSGALVLQDANNRTFYNWTLTNNTGKIFATRNSATVFTSINCTNSTLRTAEETALGQSSADADAVSRTFASAVHPAFSVGATNFAGNVCYATNAFDNTGAQSANFYQLLLSDSSNNLVYTTLMNSSKVGFDGNLWDFELLVGQNGHAGGPTSTTYYFFVELN